MTEPVPEEGLTLANKLDRLFKSMHKPGEKEHTYERVAEEIRQADPELSISATYIWQLRTGKRDNPTKKHLEALAKFFGVKPAYFFDDEAAKEIDKQLEDLQKLRDAKVRRIAFRSIELSERSQDAVLDLIEALGHAESMSSRPSRPVEEP